VPEPVIPLTIAYEIVRWEQFYGTKTLGQSPCLSRIQNREGIVIPAKAGTTVASIGRLRGKAFRDEQQK